MFQILNDFFSKLGMDTLGNIQFLKSWKSKWSQIFDTHFGIFVGTQAKFLTQNHIHIGIIESFWKYISVVVNMNSSFLGLAILWLMECSSWCPKEIQETMMKQMMFIGSGDFEKFLMVNQLEGKDCHWKTWLKDLLHKNLKLLIHFSQPKSLITYFKRTSKSNHQI